MTVHNDRQRSEELLADQRRQLLERFDEAKHQEVERCQWEVEDKLIDIRKQHELDLMEERASRLRAEADAEAAHKQAFVFQQDAERANQATRSQMADALERAKVVLDKHKKELGKARRCQLAAGEVLPRAVADNKPVIEQRQRLKR